MDEIFIVFRERAVEWEKEKHTSLFPLGTSTKYKTDATNFKEEKENWTESESHSKKKRNHGVGFSFSLTRSVCRRVIEFLLTARQWEKTTSFLILL